ncbi:MAG TPA: 5-(carboxyamino)imidazole ribonucleotide synthase [Longimicrobiales bacterium]|nr:5-(carboxyamino)imidazole ribonucleotide synthase [Longimicrobiales bacterium]
MNLGIIGGGQLGRMLALAAHPLGIRTRVLEPSLSASAAHVAGHVVAPYDDRDALERFATGLDVATYEFENVPVESARWLAERVPVRPAPAALEASQDRVVEKTTFQERAIPTAAFAAVDDAAGLAEAGERLGSPLVLKTRRWGYDGKGQAIVRSAADLQAAWRELGARPLIAEGFIRFDRELSILAVRSVDGDVLCYPLFENLHEGGILRRTTFPAARVADEMQREAETYARRMLEALDYVGVLAIELFDVGGALLANEMAPRVHNSGHCTIEGARTSQFENHVRAVCGLPLGAVHPIGHSVMINLIGAAPPIRELLAVTGAHVHLYDKQPRPGRKIGHVTVCGDDPGEVAKRADRLLAMTRR